MPELVRIEPRYLRSAIEFAVFIAGEAQKPKLSLAFPTELKGYIAKQRIPTSSLGRLRRAIEADEPFRNLVAKGAIPGVVDEVGALWLKQPANWESDAAALISAMESAGQEADLESSLRTTEKKRRAAEQAAFRTRAEIIDLSVRLESQESEADALRADLVKADDEVSELRSEIVDVRNEARHARDRESAASRKLAAALKARDEAVGSESSRAAGEAATPPDEVNLPNNDAEIEAAVGAAQELVDRLSELLPPDSGRHGSDDHHAAPSDSRVNSSIRRRAMSLPGGVIPSSGEAAQFFVRSDSEILIDGYNVAKLGWPRLDLEEQRNRLLDSVENVVRRFGADVTVVFDGASIVGAHTGRRRLTRVVFSPEGVTADDVIRDEVRRIPASRAVVVVTNDAEIVRDVRADGANVIPSNALLTIL